ncbi:OmpW family outer membrane protein [Taibaiella soli]|uniref:Outer membrane protein beta-barrel domain-containing protein n=1 Tax=Taibaiella soli TaxID=1649169 RepID=A0A2W2A9Y0_9BACT|nr:OmpW family outer membrane protein [Taibaiella soli]PZF72091.1 hypothetical protein DN068_14225 [Taibaiella soli]
MKKILFILAMICGAQIVAQAQAPAYTIHYTRDIFMGSWEIGVPTNNDFLNKTSAAGGRFEYRHMINPHVSIGVGLSWNSFEQHTSRKTYYSKDGGSAITTDVIKDIYTLPITAGVHYYFGDPHAKIKPYVGIGIGAQYSEQDVYFNIYNITYDNWGFCVRPEVGVIMPFNENVGGFVSAAYNVSTNKNDDFNISSLKHFAFNIGLAFSVR